MPKRSAGLLMYRGAGKSLAVRCQCFGENCLFTTSLQGLNSATGDTFRFLILTFQ